MNSAPPTDLDVLRGDLENAADNLCVSLIETCLSNGLGFKGPWERFAELNHAQVLDALWSARRDGAQAATEAAREIAARARQDADAQVAAVRGEGDEAQRSAKAYMGFYDKACEQRNAALIEAHTAQAQITALRDALALKNVEIEALRAKLVSSAP